MSLWEAVPLGRSLQTSIRHVYATFAAAHVVAAGNMSAWMAMQREESFSRPLKRQRIEGARDAPYVDRLPDTAAGPAAEAEHLRFKSLGEKGRKPTPVTPEGLPAPLRPHFRPPSADGKYRSCLNPKCVTPPRDFVKKLGVKFPFCVPCMRAANAKTAAT